MSLQSNISSYDMLALRPYLHHHFHRHFHHIHRKLTGQQHYDMLTTCQERNSVAVLYQVPKLEILLPSYLYNLCNLYVFNISLRLKKMFPSIGCALVQGPNAGLADSVDSPTLPCLGRLCKVGKLSL